MSSRNLRFGTTSLPVDFGKRKLNAEIKKLKANEIWDDEMMGYTDDYLDYIKSVALKFPVSPHVDIERRVDLSSYIPNLPDEDPASEARTVSCWAPESSM